MNGAEAIMGVTAAVIGVVGMLPYLRDTLGGTTRPHRATWLIWSVLAGVACVSQRADGATWSALVTLVHLVLNGAVFVLAIRRGEGGTGRRDVVLLVLASAGVVGWVVSGAPIVATLSVVVADAIGLAAMTPKTRRHPESETLSTYVAAAVGGALTAGAVGALDVSLLVYPLYYCLANGAIALLIVHRRRLLASVVPGVGAVGQVAAGVELDPGLRTAGV